MRSINRVLAMVAVALIIAGCGKEPNPGWDQPLEPEGPVMMQHGVVYLNQAFEELLVLRPQIEDEAALLEIDRVETGAIPVQMERSENGRSLYVVNRDDQTLSVFDIGPEEIERSDVEIDGAYDQITVDPEGEFLLLSHSGEAPDTIMQNVNEVAIVDLRGGVPQGVQVLTLPTQADNLKFIPPFQLDGTSERLAVALATNVVAIIDLNATEDYDRVRRAPLTTRQSDELKPTDVVFNPPTSERPHQASLFILEATSDDVTEIVLQPSTREDEHRRLAPTFNQLAAGNRPHHIAVLELNPGGDRQARRLFALDAEQPQFTLVDVDSGESVTFDLPMSSPADGMEVFSIEVPGENRVEKRILVYSHNSQLVATIRPESISVGSDTPTLGQTIQEMRLSAPPSQLIMAEGSNPDRAVALHGGGQEGATVLNLEANQNWWLSGFNPSQMVLDGRTAYGIFNNTSHMVRVNLESGQTTSFALPDRGRALFLSPDKESILVRHDGVDGRFTLLPRDTLRPDNARLYEHVFVGGILDHEAIDE